MSEQMNMTAVRLRELEQLCRERGLSAILVFGRGSNLGPGSKSHGYLRYICDWDGHQNDSVLLVRPGLPPRLVVTGIFLKFMAERYHAINDIEFVKPPALGQRCAELCLEARPDTSGSSRPGAIGLIGAGEMPANAWLPFAEAISGIDLVDLNAAIDEQRKIKSSAQLARHQVSAQVCDAMFEAFREIVRRPKPAWQMQVDIESLARREGAEFCMTWLTVAPQADYCRFFKEECQRVPQPGDQVLLGIYLLLDGYWGHAIRMGTMGEPNSDQARVFESAQLMWTRMLEALGPGKDLAVVHQAAESVLEQAYPHQLSEVFRFRHGHGLGHSYEDPVVSAAFPQAYDVGAQAQSMPAQPGMLFEIHPNLFVPGMGGAAIGDMVAVTPEGHTLLTHFPRHHWNWLA